MWESLSYRWLPNLWEEKKLPWEKTEKKEEDKTLGEMPTITEMGQEKEMEEGLQVDETRKYRIKKAKETLHFKKEEVVSAEEIKKD